MIEEQAQITRIEGEHVFIQSMQSSACQHCAQQAGCGTQLYSKILPKRELALTSALPLDQGDIVLVGIEENYLLRASLFMYLIPLLAMLIPASIVAGDDTLIALLALAGLVCGLCLVHLLQHFFVLGFMAPPRIIRKL